MSFRKILNDNNTIYKNDNILRELPAMEGMFMDSQRVYLTQSELADRWRCSPGTIINYRKKGLLPYFRLPGCSKILYKIDDIERIEQQYLIGKGVDSNLHQIKQLKHQKRERPVVSANRDWRI
jgi:hypothetical protein